HQVLVNRVSRGGELRVRERAHCDTVLSRESFALPINVAAAIRAEMKADLVAAVGITRINLARAPDSHFAFHVGSAGMHNRTCAPLACRAMAHIDAVRIARHDSPQRPTMAQCRSFHCLLPSNISCILPRASRFTKTCRCSLESGNKACDAGPLLVSSQVVSNRHAFER